MLAFLTSDLNAGSVVESRPATSTAGRGWGRPTGGTRRLGGPRRREGEAREGSCKWRVEQEDAAAGGDAEERGVCVVGSPVGFLDAAATRDVAPWPSDRGVCGAGAVRRLLTGRFRRVLRGASV